MTQRWLFALAGLWPVLVLGGPASPATGGPQTRSPQTGGPQTGPGRSLSLPLFFEPNAGQAAPSVQYIGRSAGYTVLFQDNETTLQFRDAVIGVALLGATPNVPAEPLERQSG
ncbi:MAG: hypothetical protein JNL98_17480, partial [Bryobacterales bacterium]|nr:hypothetical protein [Bryobacterales bacterium]